MAWYEKATDDFNRADENPLSKGEMWASVGGLNPFKVQNNVACPATNASQSVSRYTGYAFGANHYAECYLGTEDYTRGPAVRCGTITCYILSAKRAATKSCQLYKFTSGTFAAVGSDYGASLSSSAGVIRLEVAGNQIKIIDHGTTLATITDSSFATGYPGIYGYYTAGPVDDWKAGDEFPAATGTASISGGGTAAAQGWKDAKVAASLPGGGSLDVAGAKVVAHISGGGSLVVVGARIAAHVSGGGSLTVAESRWAQDAIAKSGGGALAVIASKGALESPSISGDGSLILFGSKGGLGDPTISGNGTVVLAGQVGARKAILVHGGGTAVAQGWKGAKVAAFLPGGGALVITYTRTGGIVHYANYSGSGKIVALGIKKARAPPAIPGGGLLRATGIRYYTDVVVRTPAKYAPVRLVYLHMDYCGRSFGTTPCLATGTPCYNTWKTCKYLSAFLNVGKTYKYSEVDAQVPFKGVRPYVKSVKLLPTEIKTNLTVNARVSAVMVDEMDQDIDTDPYIVGPGRI
jgi:hypothetical protein